MFGESVAGSEAMGKPERQADTRRNPAFRAMLETAPHPLLTELVRVRSVGPTRADEAAADAPIPGAQKEKALLPEGLSLRRNDYVTATS